VKLSTLLLKWELPEKPIPEHPYRDTAFAYGVLAVMVVLFAWATGGQVLRSVWIAALVFVVAWGWGSLRWYKRIDQAARKAERERELL
jgi:hypothetical protein